MQEEKKQLLLAFQCTTAVIGLSSFAWARQPDVLWLRPYHLRKALYIRRVHFASRLTNMIYHANTTTSVSIWRFKSLWLSPARLQLRESCGVPLCICASRADHIRLGAAMLVVTSRKKWNAPPPSVRGGSGRGKACLLKPSLCPHQQISFFLRAVGVDEPARRRGLYLL